ncbi:hypothetical protein Tco_0015550 [Tanacetum coccineum]
MSLVLKAQVATLDEGASSNKGRFPCCLFVAIVENCVSLHALLTTGLLLPIGMCKMEFHQNKASLVRVLTANLTLFFSAHLLRENIDSVRLKLREWTTASVRNIEVEKLVTCKLLKSENVGGIIPSLESFEELKEVLPDVADEAEV